MKETTVTESVLEPPPSRSTRAAVPGLVLVHRRKPCEPLPLRVPMDRVLGREADLVIDDPSVSRQHVKLEPAAEGLWVTDLGSHNGTFLDGGKLGARTLAPWDSVLRVGVCVLVVTKDAAAFEERDTRSPGLVGGPSLASVRAQVARLGPSTLPVLIEGETGTGKELVARALHDASGRSGPFVGINCAAIAPELVESELFGHTKGAFSGALAARRGLFRSAHKGTLLLDEVGELPLAMQAKLLRVLETGEVRSVGEDAVTSVDVRVVAATHRDLFALAESEEFRSDLLHRIAAAQVRLPPLRARRADVSSLCLHLLEGESVTLAATALEALMLAPFPGNVRELKNVLAVAVATVKADGRDTITADDLPQTTTSGDEETGLRARLVEALGAHDGNVTHAARALGMARSVVYEALKRLKLDPSRYRER